MIFQILGLLTHIRKPEIADLPTLQKWLSSQAYTHNFCHTSPAQSTHSATQAENMLQANADDFSNNKYFLIEDRFSGNAVALAMLCKIDWKNRHAEYAYIIGEDNYRAKLIAGDMNMVLFNHFFNALNLNKVYGYVIDGNDASVRINSFGGRLDGTLKTHRFRTSDQPKDVHVFSITRAEFACFVTKHKETLLRKHLLRGLVQCPAA